MLLWLTQRVARVLALSDALRGGSARPGDIRADCQEAARVSRSRHAWTQGRVIVAEAQV